MLCIKSPVAGIWVKDFGKKDFCNIFFFFQRKMHSSSGLNIFLLFFFPAPKLAHPSLESIWMQRFWWICCHGNHFSSLISPYRLSRPFLAFKLPFCPTFWTHYTLIPRCELHLKTKCEQSQQKQQPKDNSPCWKTEVAAWVNISCCPKMAAEESKAKSPLPWRAVSMQVMTAVR